MPRGQSEAAEALGLHYVARMRDVILPQAFRIALPPTVGYLVQVIKGTSLAAIIGFTELTRAGQIINNATFQPLLVFSLVGAIYFVLCWPLSLLAAPTGAPAAPRRPLITVSFYSSNTGENIHELSSRSRRRPSALGAAAAAALAAAASPPRRPSPT